MHLYGAAGANDAKVHVVSYVVRQYLLFASVGSESSNVLHQVVVQVMSSDDCRALGYSSLLTDNMLCVYYTNASQNVCSMVSGGSLVCRQGNNWWQYGFVTMGVGCVNAKQPEIHSSVVKYLPWIKQNTIGRCLHLSYAHDMVPTASGSKWHNIVSVDLLHEMNPLTNLVQLNQRGFLDIILCVG